MPCILAHLHTCFLRIAPCRLLTTSTRGSAVNPLARQIPDTQASALLLQGTCLLPFSITLATNKETLLGTVVDTEDITNSFSS